MSSRLDDDGALALAMHGDGGDDAGGGGAVDAEIGLDQEAAGGLLGVGVFQAQNVEAHAQGGHGAQPQDVAAVEAGEAGAGHTVSGRWGFGASLSVASTVGALGPEAGSTTTR